MKKYKAIKIARITMEVPIIVIMGMFSYHKIKLRFEARRFPPIGELAEVNGHKMHVYSEGEGEETLVFLSGSGTAAPALDFKILYSRLSKHYRIAVVERAGYGFSETTDNPRDIDTVLEETRLALSLVGESGPYVLFAHSLSGIEALYWSQKYPKEVRAVIGLDAAVPSLYLSWGEQVLNESADYMKKMSFFYQSGLGRIQPAIYNTDPAITTDILSKEEKAMYKSVVMRSYMTGNMVDEARYAYRNAEKVDHLEKPAETPAYYFISDGSQVGAGWRDMVTEYISTFKHAKYLFLDCGHYVHDEMPDVIAQESILFIDSLLR